MLDWESQNSENTWTKEKNNQGESSYGCEFKEQNEQTDDLEFHLLKDFYYPIIRQQIDWIIQEDEKNVWFDKISITR